MDYSCWKNQGDR
jgi:hypothetical protein